MAKRAKTFTVGDRVAYSAQWLRSTCNHVGDLGFLRGEVKAIEDFGPHQLCTIAWELRGKPYPMASHYHDDGLGRVISPNLTLVSRIAVDAAA